MLFAHRDLLRVQARAFNAHDVETLAGTYTRGTRIMRDGTWLGEGHEALRRGFEAEWGQGVVGRVDSLDGEPVLVEYEGEEGRGPARGVIRFEVEDGQVTACRIDHDPGLIERLGTS